jgi:radical SAM-linked protein
MAGMPVAFTQGFNKRERMAMGFALPLGLESGAELCDIDMYRRLEDPEAMIPLISSHLPEGIAAVGLSETDKSSTPLSRIDAVSYEVRVPDVYREAVIAGLEGGMDLVKQGKKGDNPVAFSDVVASFEGPDPEGLLRLVLNVGQAGSLRADSLMRQLAGLEPDSAVVFSIIKTGQFTGKGTSGMRAL